MAARDLSPKTKRKSRAGGTAVFLLAMILLLYAGYHAFYFFADPVKTERVTRGSAELSVSAEGLFFKTAFPVDNTKADHFYTLVKSGEKVAKSQRLAVAYSGEKLSGDQMELADTEEAIERLEDAINQSAAETDTGRLDTLISEELSRLDGALFQGANITYQRLGVLKSYFCRRAVIYEGRQNSVAALADLKRKKEALQKSVTGKIYNLTADKAGYFSGAYDDMDDLTPLALQNIRADDFLSLMGKTIKKTAPSGHVGSVVTDFKWYFAFYIDESPELTAGRAVDLRFTRLSDRPVRAEVIRAENTGGGLFVAVEGDAMMGELITLRKEPAELILNNYSGLKIPAPSLHYVGGGAGVYVRNGAEIGFKKVSVLYETPTSYIVKAADAQNPLSVTDDVVVAGLDLYAGKLLS